MSIRPATLLKLRREGSRGPWRILLPLLLMAWVAGLVLFQATGRLGTARALVLLVLPLVAVGVAIRPAWVVLLVAAIPIGVLNVAPTRGLAVLLLLTLGGQLMVRGRVSLGLRSGLTGLGLLVAVGFFYRYPLSGGQALVARGFLNDLAVYFLLGVLAYNATRMGDLRGRDLVGAMVIGLVASLVLERTSLAGGGAVASVGRPVAYLAAAGFAICFSRVVVRSDERRNIVLYGALTIGFLISMVPGLVRGAWLSAVISVLLVSVFVGKRRYWLLVGLAAMLLLAIPVTRERVVPNQQQASGGGFTTGRLGLWSQLWKRVDSGLPAGHGLGYTFTLTSTAVFGQAGSTSFVSPGSTATAFVYPHNDFLYWMVELGLVGLFGMLLFWFGMVRAMRSVFRFGGPNKAYVQILSGVIVTSFVSELVGSVFFFTPLANLFFIVSGFVFGAEWLAKKGKGSTEPVASGSV